MTVGKLRRENGAAVKKKRGSFEPMSRLGISCQASWYTPEKGQKEKRAETPHEVIELRTSFQQSRRGVQRMPWRGSQ